MTLSRDHGGGLDATVVQYGGTRQDWADLSTGINPVPFTIPTFDPSAWTELPDQGAMDRMVAAARSFWKVPDGCEIVAASGVSAIIAAIPELVQVGRVSISDRTYNEHRAAFVSNGWTVVSQNDMDGSSAQVVVHPNNPSGHLAEREALKTHHRDLTIIDESFCDVTQTDSLIDLAAEKNFVILKGLGKFWGLAGVRLGFAVCKADLAQTLRDRLGPWAVSGPALAIGAAALSDTHWADQTCSRLRQDAARLDDLATTAGLTLVGGTDLFRLYQVPDAKAVQAHLASHKIWTRVFPYDPTWIRLGFPKPQDWKMLEAALWSLT